MDFVELIGTLAGACTTLSFVPQALQVWKTRRVADISLAMYLVFVTGIVLWLAYGLFIESRPLIFFNIVTLFLAGSVLAMKIVYGRRQQV